MNLKALCLLAILLVGFTSVNAQQEFIEIGQKFTIKSEILSEERAYWVSLPASYEQSHSSYKNYPVIYLLDGHIHFASVAGMCQFMGRPSNGSRKIPEMIVVGVMNVDRQRDFTPDKIITRRENNTGGGAKFLAFLEKELIPEIDREFRTNSFSMLFGHSLGGLLVSHAYLQAESAFNAFIAIDPSFGTWDNSVMDEKIDKISENIFERPLYMSTANWDKRNIRNRDRHIRFFELLNSRCTVVFKGKIEYFENESHSTVSLPAFYSAMSYLFEGYSFSYRDAGDINSVSSVYQELSKRLNYDFKVPEELVNRIGYSKLRSSDQTTKALGMDFFKFNVRNYPNSYNVYDSMGEAEYRFGNMDAALQNFQKSIELNSENENAIRMIQKINTEQEKSLD